MILLSKITLNTFLYGKVVSILWKSGPGAMVSGLVSPDLIHWGPFLSTAFITLLVHISYLRNLSTHVDLRDSSIFPIFRPKSFLAISYVL